jgi:hypothetical protein
MAAMAAKTAGSASSSLSRGMICGSVSASGVLSERRAFASAKNSTVERNRFVHSLVMALSSMSREGDLKCVLRAICVL